MVKNNGWILALMTLEVLLLGGSLLMSLNIGIKIPRGVK